MKNVLLLIHDDRGQEARLRTALDLTHGLAAHLTCLDIIPPPISLDRAMSLLSASGLEEAKRGSEDRARLQRRIDAEHISWNWDEVRDDLVPCLIGAAAVADVVVLSRLLDDAERPNMLGITSSVLMHTNALVVAVSQHCRGMPLNRAALVAWDGSDQASQALQRALPLLRKASRVTVFQAGKLPEEALAAEEAVSFLARQNVKSQIEIAPESSDVAEEIRLAASRMGATYCVMGAFGHSRIRETLFGGVTREMLTKATLPIALAH